MSKPQPARGLAQLTMQLTPGLMPWTTLHQKAWPSPRHAPITHYKQYWVINTAWAETSTQGGPTAVLILFLAPTTCTQLHQNPCVLLMA